MKNKTVALEMDKYVTDSNLDAISIETSIPEEQFSFENSNFQWNVSEELRTENKTVYLRFTANDSMGASSEYWPDLYYCGCEGESGCDYSVVLEDNDNEDHFYNARCNCTDDREGTYCENIKDRCEPNPCYENVTCDSMQGDNPCGACPVGLSGDGLRCEDTNECNMEPPACNQTCNNIVGSYLCSCLGGYTLSNDGRNCDDIDECEKRETNDCADAEICRNSPGSYSCQCAAGYAPSDGACIEVISSFVGSLVFEAMNNDTVTAESIEQLLLDEVKKKEARIIASEVTEIERKRDDGPKTMHQTTFVLYSGNDTLKTEDVETVFDGYIQSIEGETVIVSDGIPVPINISKESRMFKDGEYGICNITDKVTCDLETTNCAAEDGIQTCSCKEGFQPWSIQYLSCKDIDECSDNDNICGDHGTCKNSIGSYSCACDTGYRLDETGLCKDVCASNPCKNGGTCAHIDGESIYSCQCMDGWTGFSCEVENSDAAKMKLIAIAVGSSVGAVCVILLCISVLLCRHYKLASKGYKREQSTREYSEKRGSYQEIRIPRPSVNATTGYGGAHSCYRNVAYDNEDTVGQALSDYGKREQYKENHGDDTDQYTRQRQKDGIQEYF